MTRPYFWRVSKASPPGPAKSSERQIHPHSRSETQTPSTPALERPVFFNNYFLMIVYAHV